MSILGVAVESYAGVGRSRVSPAARYRGIIFHGNKNEIVCVLRCEASVEKCGYHIHAVRESSRRTLETP